MIVVYALNIQSSFIPVHHATISDSTLTNISFELRRKYKSALLLWCVSVPTPCVVMFKVCRWRVIAHIMD